MSEPTDTPDFERAQFDDPSEVATLCRVCQAPPGSSYFSVNGQNVCPRCLEGVRASLESSFLKALALGLGAGALGALVYYGIRLATGYDLALITIGLGSIVGIAVRQGAGGSQSAIYRLMAVALAWIAMSSTYVPLIAPILAGETPQESDGASQREAPAAEAAPAPSPEDQPSPGTIWAVSAVVSIVIPFLFLADMDVLALIIFGVGLWEAWRRSAAPPFVVTGPFMVSSPQRA